MNPKQSIVGSSLAFLIATSCCWLPALIIAIGGGTTILGISKGIESLSGLFMTIGIGLLVFGVYQFSKRKTNAMNQEIILQSPFPCPACGNQKEETMQKNACQNFYE